MFTCERSALLRGEEVDGLRRGDGLDVLWLEAEQLYPQHDLALKLRIVELARYQPAHRHLARGRNRELQNELALQLRPLAQRAAVEGINRALVAVKDELNLLARARRFAARARARGRAAIKSRVCNRGGDCSGLMSGERACAGAKAAARVRRGNAATAGADFGGDEGTLRVRVSAHSAGEVLRLPDCWVGHLLAQIRELVFDLFQLLLGLLARLLGAIHRRRLDGYFLHRLDLGRLLHRWWWWRRRLHLLLDHYARQTLRNGLLTCRARWRGQQRDQDSQEHEQREPHPQDPAVAHTRLGIAFPGQFIAAVIGD